MPACRPLPCRERTLTSLAFVLAAVLAFTGFMREARAETYDTCAGFIDSVPATITTQGVWCLRHDVATSQASGSAIEIATNNVTIDCNGFKIGGLAAGDTSSANGIYAYNRRNAVVRNCNIRGFFYGIYLTGGSGTQAGSSGHLVEDNRIDNSLRTGIRIFPGDGSLVRHNRVFDTGGAPGMPYAEGIYADADVIDNVVSGLFATATNTYPSAIAVYGGGNVVRGNILRGFVVGGTGSALGIRVSGDGNRASGNHMYQDPNGTGTGISAGTMHNYCSGNTFSGFATPLDTCANSGGNYAN